MTRTLTAAVLVLLASASALADADVRLMLDESTILPGTPTGLTVVVTNPDKTALELPPSLWLVVTDDAMRRSRTNPTADSSWFTIAAEERVVPPGGTREFRFDPSVSLTASPFFIDGRLAPLGKYRLRAVFSPRVDPDGAFEPSESLASKEEVLTVATQSPDDAAVWAWMSNKDGGARWAEWAWTKYGNELSELVRKTHPESSYALYTVMFRPDDLKDRRDELVAAQIARFPKNSYSDQLRLYLAQEHQKAGRAEDARKIASELVANSRSSRVRKEAQRLLAERAKQ